MSIDSLSRSMFKFDSTVISGTTSTPTGGTSPGTTQGPSPNVTPIFSGSNNGSNGALFSNPSPSNANSRGEAVATPAATLLYQPEALVTNAKVYILAEQYDVQLLKHIALNKYGEILPHTWNSISFVESLRLIYDGTPDGTEMDMLRKAATQVAGEHAKELMRREEFRALCKERGDIASDVMEATAPKQEPQQPPSASSGRFNLHNFHLPKCNANAEHKVEFVPMGFTITSHYRCATCHSFII
jgi:hypothetical protein